MIKIKEIYELQKDILNKADLAYINSNFHNKVIVGDLKYLTTLNKDSLVDAINEVNLKPGGGGGSGGNLTPEQIIAISKIPVIENKINDIDIELLNKSPLAHKHTINDIEGSIKGDKGDTWKPILNSNGDLRWEINNTQTKPIQVNIKGPKGDAGTTSWNELNDKPTSFDPSPHRHDGDYYRKVESYNKEEVNNLIANNSGGSGSNDWNNIINKPQTYPPNKHNHNEVYFTKDQMNANFSPDWHNHNAEHYTKDQSDSKYAIKSHNHDKDYYKKTEIDNVLNGTKFWQGTKLDYDNIESKDPNTLYMTNDTNVNNSSCDIGKEIVKYTHIGNREIHMTAIDYATGIITCKEPHNLTTNTEVFPVPNGWMDYTQTNKPGGYNEGLLSIPIEILYTDNKKILLEVIDSNTLKIIREQTNDAIVVNIDAIENKSIDILKWHFEIFVPWYIKGLEIYEMNRVKVLISGYSGYSKLYRYSFPFLKYEDQSISQTSSYIGILGIPMIPNCANISYGIFSNYSIEMDFTKPTSNVSLRARHCGRRKGYSHIVFDRSAEENIVQYFSIKMQSLGLAQYRPNANYYFHMSNGTTISFIKMGGV